VASIQHTAPKAWRFMAEMDEIAATFESVGIPGDFPRAAREIYARLASFKGVERPELQEALAKLTASRGSDLSRDRQAAVADSQASPLANQNVIPNRNSA
jgi:hypothetical protein